MTTRIIVFGLYFLGIFAIGLYGMRKTRDESDYWIAGGDLGWGLGGVTLAATHVSGGTFIGAIGAIYAFGWSFGWVLISIPLAYWFMAAVLAPRLMGTRELTLPSFIERRYYSKTARAIAAVIIMVAIMVYMQAQIVAGGLVANIAFGVPLTHGIIFFAILLLAYTVVGGMLAVVYADFVQMIIMLLGTLIALPLALRQIGGADNLLHYAQLTNPLALDWGTLPAALLFTMGLAFFLGSVATPEKIVRLYSMRDMHQIRRGILLTIVLVVVLNLMIMVLGLVSMVLFPTLPTGDLAMPMIARAVLPSFIGSLMLAAITSAIMSTAEALLIVAGSALSEDIYQSFFERSASPRRRLIVGRIGVFIVGVAPLLFVLTGIGKGELIQLIVLLFSAIMAASFFAPVIGGIFWRRATREGAIAAMLGGVAAAGAWKMWGPSSIDPVLPGFAVSVIAYVVVSLVTPRPPASALAPYFPGEGAGGGSFALSSDARAGEQVGSASAGPA